MCIRDSSCPWMTISTDNKCFKQNLDHNPITLPPYKETFCGKISDGKNIVQTVITPR